MNYIPIHTNVAPNYNYLSAENAYLKHNIEYKDAVICEQQGTITKLQADVNQLSQANMNFKQENEKLKYDAQRWQKVKQIMFTQLGEQQMYEVQKMVDRERGK